MIENLKYSTNYLYIVEELKKRKKEKYYEFSDEKERDFFWDKIKEMDLENEIYKLFTVKARKQVISNKFVIVCSE